MKIELGREFYLSKLQTGDEDALILHMRDKEIFDNTLRIPYPYTEQHAQEWIQHNLAEYQSTPMPMSFAIRRQDGFLIGGVGFEIGIQPHQAEIGYWLAKSYWGHGIVTDAVKAMCEYGFNSLGLVRITAHVYLFNPASARVLEKSGFLLEGILRKSHFKNGKYFDSKLFANVQDLTTI